MLVVIVAIGVAFWRELGADGREAASPTASTSAGTAREHRDADTAQALAGPRATARPAAVPCARARAQAPHALRGITLECAGDGTPVDVARVVAGRDGRAQPVGLLVRALRRRTTRDGRVPATDGRNG